jgi:hypothetical protein
MGNQIILTQKEVDAGKAPAHTSCRTIEVNGETRYLFYGHTGSKKATITQKVDPRVQFPPFKDMPQITNTEQAQQLAQAEQDIGEIPEKKKRGRKRI